VTSSLTPHDQAEICRCVMQLRPPNGHVAMNTSLRIQRRSSNTFWLIESIKVYQEAGGNRSLRRLRRVQILQTTPGAIINKVGFIRDFPVAGSVGCWSSVLVCLSTTLTGSPKTVKLLFAQHESYPSRRRAWSSEVAFSLMAMSQLAGSLNLGFLKLYPLVTGCSVLVTRTPPLFRVRRPG